MAVVRVITITIDGHCGPSASCRVLCVLVLVDVILIHHGRHFRRQTIHALRPLWFSPVELEPSTPDPTIPDGVATVRPFFPVM